MSFDPIELAQSATLASTFERAVLEELQRHVGFDAAFFATKGDSATTVNLDAQQLDRAISRPDYASEVAPTRAAAVASRGVAVDTRVLSELAVQQFAYHRDFAAPIGGRHSLMALLRVRGRPFGGLMLGRCAATFSDHDIRFIEDVMPRLAIARASFHLPWQGARLDAPARSRATRAVDWFRGEHVVDKIGNRASQIAVRDRGGYREMVALENGRELVWSRASLEDPERSGWFYVDLLHLAAARARRQRRILFIGSGGAVAVRQFARVYPGVELDLVESDPRVIELARRWFGLDEVPNLSVAIEDGTAFVRRAPRSTWDVIVVDAYDASELSKPFAQRRFFADARRALRAGGGLAFNVIGVLGGSGVVREVERAARAELDDVRLVPVLDPDETYSPTAIRNVVLVGRAPLVPSF
jgi:spermidine synthase